MSQHLRSLVVLGLVAAARPTAAQCIGTPISGTLASVTLDLARSPYCVIGDLSLATVRIEPGVVLQVDGNFRISVLSGLTAVGTEEAQILFTSSTGDWNGIVFDHSPPNSSMEWCIVEKADESGITILDSLPRIVNCTIQDNLNPIEGGGLRIDVGNGHLALKDCSILRNTSNARGGGLSIDMDGGFSCILEGCTIEGNTVNLGFAGGSFYGGGVFFTATAGNLVCAATTVRENYVNAVTGYAQGGGIYAQYGNVQIVGGSIVANWARGFSSFPFCGLGQGGGILYYAPENTLDVRNTVIAYNHSLVPGTCEASGCAVYIATGTASIVNSTLVRNGALSADSRAVHNEGTTTIRNSILYWNNPSGVCGGAITYGPQLGGSGTTNVSYSDVQNGGVPVPGTGNIDVSPVFVNSGNPNCDLSNVPDPGLFDPHLVYPGSPCVDAGMNGVADRDACFPPSQGAVRNDMGFTGGPQACPDASPALLASRNCGANPDTYSATKIVLGAQWCGTVDCPPSGHPLFLIGFYDAPLNLVLPSGTCALVNLSRPRLVTVGPTACGNTLCFQVPFDLSLLGCAFYSQAAHFGLRPVLGSNAQDFVVGTY